VVLTLLVADKSVTVGVKASAIAHMMVTMHHFLQALSEVTPAVGVQEDALRNLIHGGLYDYSVEFQRLMDSLRKMVRQIVTSTNTRLLSILLEGCSGTGKSAIAASLGLIESDDSNSGIFPFVKVISPEQYLGMGEAAKSHEISRAFDDAYKSPLSLIILDNIERLLDYTPIGPRFSNTVLQTLAVLISRCPPNPSHKLVIIGTTADGYILESMQLKASFTVVRTVPMVCTPSHFRRVFELTNTLVSPAELSRFKFESYCPMSIKTLLFLVDMVKQNSSSSIDTNTIITADCFEECARNAGLFKDEIF